MIERQWQSCARPDLMLARLPFHFCDTGLKRKWRLLICGCCRLAPGLMAEPACRHAIEVAERHADGLASRQERDEARRALLSRWGPAQAGQAAPSPPARLAACAGVPTANLPSAAAQAVAAAARLRVQDRLGSAFLRELAGQWKLVQAEERAVLCGLIRCIFGNPFRPPPAVEPAWLAWGGGVVARMARGVYDRHAFDDLPVLDDALLDAGCTYEAILTHLRSPGPHVRGCWALDSILGRS